MSYAGNFPDFLSKFQSVIDDIDRFPETKTFINPDRWLPMDNIVNGHIKASDAYIKALTELADLLDSELITNEGQHSEFFYELRKYGYQCETGERDSIGPLSSIFSPLHRNWRVSYG